MNCVLLVGILDYYLLFMRFFGFSYCLFSHFGITCV